MKKMKKAQPTVSGSETGRLAVSENNVAKVLKARGLPKDWSAPAPEVTASDMLTELLERERKKP